MPESGSFTENALKGSEGTLSRIMDLKLNPLASWTHTDTNYVDALLPS